MKDKFHYFQSNGRHVLLSVVSNKAEMASPRVLPRRDPESAICVFDEGRRWAGMMELWVSDWGVSGQEAATICIFTDLHIVSEGQGVKLHFQASKLQFSAILRLFMEKKLLNV